MITKRMAIMLLLTSLVFGLVFGLKALGSYMMNDAIDNAPPMVMSISTSKALTDNWVQSLSAVGTVRAVNGVNITNEVAGTVKAIHIRSGEQVKQGDLLVELDASTDRAQLKALNAAARLAQQDYQRFARLFKQGSISKAELERKQSEHDQAQANAEAQAELVAKKTLRAPFSGRLGIRQVDLGQYLSAGTSVVSLTQLDPVHVNFSLPEQQLPAIREQLEVQVRLSTDADRLFDGTVTVIEPSVNATTRNVNIQATLDNKDGALRPGMFADIRIQLASSQAVLVVPRTAISFAPYGNSVYVIEQSNAVDGEPQWLATNRLVKLGQQRGDLVAITNGLAAGESVATSGLLKLRNGAPVKPENDVQPPAQSEPQPDNS